MLRHKIFAGQLKSFIIQLIFALLGLLAATTASAETNAVNGESPIIATENSGTVSEAPLAVPRRFRGLALGMSLEALKQALLSDDYFTFRGDADVSFLPVGQEYIVETSGYSFIRRAFFQLKDDAVFMMSFVLDQDLIDHYSLFSTLLDRYGEPLELSPKSAIWLSETTRLAVERPLTVKYIDRLVFDDFLEAAKTKEASRTVLRQEFLDAF